MNDAPPPPDLPGVRVRILDLSGGAEEGIVEEVGPFPDVETANAFARRYVRDSVERCRATGMTPQAVLDAWFAFGEDAEVLGAAGKDFEVISLTDDCERCDRLFVAPLREHRSFEPH